MHQWILALMMSLRLTEPVKIPWADTFDSTATGIETAAHASPLPGRDGEATAAAILTVMAWQESRFNPQAKHDADKVSKNWLGFGEWGVQAKTVKNIPGCTEPELIDPSTGALCALKLIHMSFQICKGHPQSERLGWYAYGREGCEHALGLSRHRMGIVERLMQKNPPPRDRDAKAIPAAPEPVDAGPPGTQHFTWDGGPSPGATGL